MLPVATLYLLRSNIKSLLDAPYFSAGIQEYIALLLKAVDTLGKNWSAIAPQYQRKVVGDIFNTHQYIAGSTSNDIPFEVEYCLKKALAQWIPGESIIITTSLLFQLDFHFQPANPWGLIQALCPSVERPKHSLVQIALPKIYKHSPLHCVPLFHELGHYLDKRKGIVDFSMSLCPTPLTEVANEQGLQPEVIKEIEISHRGEFFADLFAACYTGSSNVRFLETLVGPSTGPTRTHPSVHARKTITKLFMTNQPCGLVNLLNDCLEKRGLMRLNRFFSRNKQLNRHFKDYRPSPISSDSELFGTFAEADLFSRQIGKTSDGRWDQRSHGESIKIVNDLTEKTIRNYMTVESWRSATA